MAELEVKIKDQKVRRLFNRFGSKFVHRVRDEWAEDAQIIIGEIVKEQLSGRPGLNRVTGNASRALNSTTHTTPRGNIIQRFFIDEKNPAKIYLHIHDRSRSGDGVIYAQKAPYLVFEGREGNLIKVKSVKIPARTDIVGAIKSKANKSKITSIRKIIKEIERSA